MKQQKLVTIRLQATLGGAAAADERVQGHLADYRADYVAHRGRIAVRDATISSYASPLNVDSRVGDQAVERRFSSSSSWKWPRISLRHIRRSTSQRKTPIQSRAEESEEAAATETGVTTNSLIS